MAQPEDLDEALYLKTCLSMALPTWMNAYWNCTAPPE